MKILFATSNNDKIAEARVVLGPLGHDVIKLIIDGKSPDFIEPQADDIEVISKSKIFQSLKLISGTEFEGCVIMVEDSGLFIHDL